MKTVKVASGGGENVMRVWKKKGSLEEGAGEDSCPPETSVACKGKEIDFGDSCIALEPIIQTL